MTVTNENNRISYAGNGSTQDFSFPYYYLEKSHLVVMVVASDGTETIKALTTDYTLTDPATTGGTVSMNVAPLSTDQLVIYREVPATQEFNPEEGGALPADSIEEALDKLTMLVQQLQDQVNRSIVLSPATLFSGLRIPDPESTKLLGWNSLATALVNYTPGADAESVFSPLGILLGGKGTVGEMCTLLTGAALVAEIGATAPAALAAVMDDQLGRRNVIINGDMRVSQRSLAAAQTITAAAALAYCLDRWYAWCTGANVAVQQVTVAGRSRLRITGAASVTAVGIGQRIERLNSAHLAGGNATLQVAARSSSLTELGWAVYYATTDDAFGSLASPTRTEIDSGTFEIDDTDAVYSASFAVPAEAITGIEVVLTGGAILAAQTLHIGDIQLERGEVATKFEVRPIGDELALCRRYYQAFGGDAVAQVFALGTAIATNNVFAPFFLPVPMRAAPVGSISAAANFSVSDGLGGEWASNSMAIQSANISPFVCVLDVGIASAALTVGRVEIVKANNTTDARLKFSAEL